MRPRFTWQKALLLAFALALVGGLTLWLSRGAPLGGKRDPGTAGKLAFVSDKNGNADLWLMNGTDGSGAVALTSGPSEDRSPAWSPGGDALAFISDRRGGYQVFLLDPPRPGGTPRPLTITSSTKDAPGWGPGGRVTYLASGQLVATTPGTNEADAILPSADRRIKLANLLSSGGFSWARVSPDGKAGAAILRLESGEALLYSPPETEFLFLLGLARSIKTVWLPDNTLAAVFSSGAPSPEPVPLLDKAGLDNPQYFVSDLPPVPEMETNFLARFGADGAPASVVALPHRASGLAVSPDGAQAALTADEGTTGVFLVSFAGGDSRRIHKSPASDPAWSPDGKTLTFVSGKDIWAVTPGEGANAAPRNLTKGTLGQCSSPTWSPAKPAKQP